MFTVSWLVCREVRVSESSPDIGRRCCLFIVALVATSETIIDVDGPSECRDDRAPG